MLGAGDELLRRLGSGSRPDGARARSPRGAIEGLGFGELLEASTRVGGGGAPIAVGDGLGLELSEEIRERLGRVADRAVAMGLGRIVAVVEGGVVEVDAGRRAVMRTVGDSGDEPLTGVDGLAVLTGDVGADRLFGVGLHGPRPSERVVEADARERAEDGSAQPMKSGASIAVSGGVSGALLALLAGMEADRERSAGGAEGRSGNRSSSRE